MTEFNKEQADNWIREYWTGSKNCQVCQSNKWQFLESVWELRSFHGGDLVVGESPVLPVVAVMCNVCGHTLFFNAIAVRAVDKQGTREEPYE